MKYYFAFICAFFLLDSLFAQSPIIIEGRLKGVEEGTMITLMKTEGNVGISVAKDSIVNGRFSISYSPDTQDLGEYSLMGTGEGFPSMSLRLWSKAGNHITIEGKDKLIYSWDVESSIPQQAEWSYFIKANKESWEEYQKLVAQRSTLINTYYDDNVSKEERKVLKTQMDSLDRLASLYNYEIDKSNLALLQKEGKMTEVRLGVLKGIAQAIKWDKREEFRPAVEELYGRLNTEMKESRYGEEIALALYPPQAPQIGDPLYDAALHDLTDRVYHLADFKGRYILLDFWSYGCGPCHASVPEMKELHEKYSDSLTIVSLSSDNRKMWEEASKVFGMTWLNLSDGKENRGIYAKYGINGIPHYVLIAPDGKIKATWTGYGAGSLKRKISEFTGISIVDHADPAGGMGGT
ncbi:AhpC/TSA family protein [Sphingobacterium alkalisoli]|uniref:AhpC/TSA family protein n=1 Tax=Sphingobacterium alkalisoli TaxID=1874115 RepID=A0A4U0H622_9SPHI|nr:TlpA disulfide reductase family protein [Sphingobacterium alkalisoli]TJY67086.1 AhpC/TSA family protein [Sphingobacterium alkalisoli]GGH12341.1 hypothetical protein GCM10011418_11800 [Sphingobacterium alkalisoli]